MRLSYRPAISHKPDDAHPAHGGPILTMPESGPHRILAIAPGTWHLGFAVLEGEELIRFGVKTFSGKKTERVLLARVRRFLDELRLRYQPQMLAVEQSFYAQARLSLLLRSLTAAVLKWGRENGLQAGEYLPTTVKERLCPAKRTRRKLAEAVVARYPFLSPSLKNNHTSRARLYWQQMFDAVGLAISAATDVALVAPRSTTTKGSTCVTHHAATCVR